MDHIFIDTNVILDSALRRTEFEKDAMEIVDLGRTKHFKNFCSTLSIVNAHFQMKKFFSEQDCRVILERHMENMRLIALTKEFLLKGFSSNFSDFEDSLQYYTALEAKADYIITRNKKDFKKSKIPVMTPSEFLEQL